MRTRFEVDRDFESQLMHEAGVRELVEGLTEAVADRARQLTHSRRVRDAIETEMNLEMSGYVGRVTVGNFIGGFIEFGTSQQPARPYLRPALESEVGPLQAGSDA